jgi:hypothetical protein
MRRLLCPFLSCLICLLSSGIVRHLLVTVCKQAQFAVWNTCLPNVLKILMFVAFAKMKNLSAEIFCKSYYLVCANWACLLLAVWWRHKGRCVTLYLPFLSHIAKTPLLYGHKVFWLLGINLNVSYAVFCGPPSNKLEKSKRVSFFSRHAP